MKQSVILEEKAFKVGAALRQEEMQRKRLEKIQKEREEYDALSAEQKAKRDLKEDKKKAKAERNNIKMKVKKM